MRDLRELENWAYRYVTGRGIGSADVDIACVLYKLMSISFRPLNAVPVVGRHLAALHCRCRIWGSDPRIEHTTD